MIRRALTFAMLALTLTLAGLPAAEARHEGTQLPRNEELQMPRGEEPQLPRGEDTQYPRGDEDQKPRGEGGF